MIAVVIETHQRYGGPEEGGWWYFVSEFVRHRVCTSKRAARRQKRRWQRELTLPTRDHYGQEVYAQVITRAQRQAIINSQRVKPHYE